MPAAANEYEIAKQLHGQGRLAEAAGWYARFLAGMPDFAEGHFNLGAVLHVLGRLDEAAARYARAIELRPEYAIAHNNLGNIYQDRENFDAAVECYRNAVAANPSFAEAWNNLGTALNDLQRYAEATECLRRALELDPDYPEAHNNLGIALQEQGRIEEAEASYRQAVQIDPASASAHNNLASVLCLHNAFHEAEAAYRKAIWLNPAYAEAHNNLGGVLKETGRFRDAEQAYCRALALNPDYADAHSNLGLLLLLLGDLESGWREYEWRWKCKPHSAMRFAFPSWEGQDLAGKTIVIQAEQGLGDILQFVRYAKLVKQRGARVILKCPPPLLTLLRHCPGIDQLANYEDDIASVDFESPLLSLPRVLRTTLTTIPDDVPYMDADPELVSYWKSQLADLSGIRVGINWHGRGGRGHFRKRDLPLDRCAALARIPHVRLVSLQHGARQELNTSSNPEIWFPSADFDTARGSFMDTAAILKNLDLVITSDTAIAHLAGALGVPVWVPLPFIADWRWLLDRNDSPWYPTMRLFRQSSVGDWESVFRQIAAELTNFPR